jgi:hypothetical protein
MKRFVSFLVAIPTAVAVLGAFPALVGADHGVPFKGSAELTLTGVQMHSGSTVLTYVGTGNSTQLGLFSEVATVVVNNMTGSFSASVVLTAANGDQVFKRAVGANVSAGMFTVLGGTGRFVNATGTGVVMHVFSNGITDVAQTFEGTIQF